MAITAGISTSYLLEAMQGEHDFDNDTFKIALYTSSATIGPSTTEYTASGEVTGTGYTAGGINLTATATFPKDDTGVAIMDFEDAVFSDVTITARGALIYNSTKTNKAVMVIDFGEDKGVTAGTLTVVMPAGDAANAVLRHSAA